MPGGCFPRDGGSAWEESHGAGPIHQGSQSPQCTRIQQGFEGHSAREEKQGPSHLRGVKRSHTAAAETSSPAGQRCTTDDELPGPSAAGTSSTVQSPGGLQDSSRSEGELSSEEEVIAPRRSAAVDSGVTAVGPRPGRPGKSMPNVDSSFQCAPVLVSSSRGVRWCGLAAI